MTTSVSECVEMRKAMDRVTPNALELKRLGGYLFLSWHDLSDHVS